MRIGTGFDLHRLGAERPLVLGGVTIPDSPGLIGHSDADCVLHAIADALLGAAALGDIGQHFPDSDPDYRDADSAGLLKEVLNLVKAEGYQVCNVDCTILAQRPKLAPHRDAMQERIADILGLPRGATGVKFTTLEGLGALGRAEGIACQAVALLQETKAAGA